MNTMFTLIIVVQVISALAIIGLVLVQHGKGADMGAAFGSGASGSLFGATGSSNFLSKSTGIAAAIFFCSTIALAYIGSKPGAVSGGVMENLPAAPVTAPDASVPVPSTPPAPAAAQSPAPAANAPAGSPGPASQIPK
jgi:preprotein translocase subunit SecG